ncbi:MAG: hypothetical protein Q9227_007134 [Pyrenula ochraceoflavens]
MAVRKSTKFLAQKVGLPDTAGCDNLQYGSCLPSDYGPGDTQCPVSYGLTADSDTSATHTVAAGMVGISITNIFASYQQQLANLEVYTMIGGVAVQTSGNPWVANFMTFLKPKPNIAELLLGIASILMAAAGPVLQFLKSVVTTAGRFAKNLAGVSQDASMGTAEGAHFASSNKDLSQMEKEFDEKPPMTGEGPDVPPPSYMDTMLKDCENEKSNCIGALLEEQEKKDGETIPSYTNPAAAEEALPAAERDRTVDPNYEHSPLTKKNKKAAILSSVAKIFTSKNPVTGQTSRISRVNGMKGMALQNGVYGAGEIGMAEGVLGKPPTQVINGSSVQIPDDAITRGGPITDL